MSEGIKSKANMAALLEEELEALERQRDQYALAMDSATDSKVAIRLQRTLERIEDEIEGVEATLAGLPKEAVAAEVADAEATEPEVEDAAAEPEAAELEAAEPEVAEPQAAEPEAAAEPQVQVSPEHEVPAIDPADPEWDDEPSTAIYEPERVRAQLAELDAMRKREEAEAAEAGAATEVVAEAADPVSLQPSVAPEAQNEDEDEDEDVGGAGNPLGPVWMDPVSPPAGNLSDDEIAEAAGSAPAPEPASPDVLGDDPFAMPSRPVAPAPAPAAAESSSPFGAAAESSSPFGAAAEPSSPFGAGGEASPFGAAPADAPFGAPSAGSDFGNPISVLDDDLESADWGFGAKALLFLMVAGFVAGAFYIMSIG